MTLIHFLTIPPEYEFAKLMMPVFALLLALSTTISNHQRKKLENQNKFLRQQVSALEEELNSLRQQIDNMEEME